MKAKFMDIIKRKGRLKMSIMLFVFSINLFGQKISDNSKLTIDRIYSGEFIEQVEGKVQWIENGDFYLTTEKSKTITGAEDLIKYSSKTNKRTPFLLAEDLIVNSKPLPIQSFSLSTDNTKVLLFNNTSRVWRSHTKGDYWVYDFKLKTLKQIGAQFDASSLMFAKFSDDNKSVFYVHEFNIYHENLETSEIIKLTKNGNKNTINGTFDWAYEEEFGKRDGFILSPKGAFLAFWNFDVSKTGIHYMINNTDSIYSKPIPLFYPKVGEPPSIVKIKIIDLATQQIIPIPIKTLEDDYIPSMQWVNSDMLLIQQMNRHQNKLTVWSYKPSSKTLKKVYTETHSNWIDLHYPEITNNAWGNNYLKLVENGASFIRMVETTDWRKIYKININSGEKTLITPFDFDVASIKAVTKEDIYFIASPENSMQRYLYATDLKGKGLLRKLTPKDFNGINNYNIAPNGKYAFYTHKSAKKVRTVRLIKLPNHKILKTVVDNELYTKKIKTLQLPEVRFEQVFITDSIEVDFKMVLPTNFDETQEYPVIFNVYGEPWGQKALDDPLDLWEILMAQKGYVIVKIDNRGTPCLKGSTWRKSIYRKLGVLNTTDQANAAKEVIKKKFIDPKRTCVWGWSGGGSMTLNLLFKYPEIYKSGIAVAAVSNQLIYDNIYQERYMGLPQENMKDYINGSPVTYAKHLEGNLLLIHGTGDDNVHYQSAELLVNELIKHNKQFRMMAYPNRSHSIYEGENTRKHLYTLLTNYILEKNPPN